MKKRYKAIVAYNGQNYHGWAKQLNQITIQGLLEQTIYSLFKQKVVVYGSGRTDAGVNALGQTIHFDLENIKITPAKLMQAINKALPYDIKVLSIRETDKNFNARFDAKSKTYVYTINLGKYNPIESSYIYQYCKELNLKAIKEIAKLFIGSKNFLGFSTDARKGESTIKKINKINFSKKGNILKITINGNGFLRSMVRMIVGCFIAYSEKKIDKKVILDCFEKPSKGKITFKAPACGLCLYKVIY